MRKEILRVLVVAVFGLPALSGNSAIAASEWESAAKLLSKTALNFGIGEAQIPVPEMQEIVVPDPTPGRFEKESSKGTLVLVQIDGLGYARLMEALEKGYAPNLAALLGQGDHQVASYRNGVPAVTMAVQSEIFYGELLPGNEWYSKTKDAEILATKNERKFASESGLLYGGKAYMSELSGGAQHVAVVKRTFSEKVERLGWEKAVLEELSAIRPLFLKHLEREYHKRNNGSLSGFNIETALKEFVINMAKEARALRADFLEKGYKRKVDFQVPAFFSFTGNIGSNVAKEGIIEAMQDGTPVVYADFATYDEYAHYYGASAPEAFKALEKIDGQIGDIISAFGNGNSTLVIFSDHGQTPSENFADKFGKTAQQAVDMTLKEVGLEAKVAKLVFTHVYSLGNIYVKDVSGHLTFDQFQSRFPGFVEAFLKHPGIGMIAARQEDGQVKFLGDDLASYADDETTVDILRTQIHNYLEVEETGDLVVFAPYQGGSTFDYNDKYTFISEHGGIGGDQMHPFIIYNRSELPLLEPEAMTDARGLYRVFRDYLDSRP